MRRIVLTGLALALLCDVSVAQPIALSPGQIGQIFCISRLGNDMAAVEALLTPDLKAAIAEAEERNAAWETANPGDKPPLGDGIPWQAWQDYAAQCTAGTATIEAGTAELAISYGFPDYPDANFTDTLEFRQVANRWGDLVWRIDNVRYADGDLRSALRDAFNP